MFQQVAQRLFQLNKTHRVGPTRQSFIAASRNRDSSCNTGSNKPWLHWTFQHSQNFKVLQQPALQVESVFHIQPLAGCDEAQHAFRLQERGCMRPKIAMQIRAARQLGTAHLRHAPAIELFGACFRSAVFGFRLCSGNVFLSHVRRVGNHRVQWRDCDALVFCA